MFSKNILEIAKIIKNNNGNLYLVGGALRDKILGLPIHDLDFCVTGINSSKFKDIFPKAKIIGKIFPVFLINSDEFALARKENKISNGHLGFEVIANENITIIQDLKRRDITINAIAMEVLTGKIIDPFNGMKDLKNHVIRHVSNSFCEDPLRVYRTARFSAKFNFDIAKDTLSLMKILRDELNTLSQERVFAELKKALATPIPSKFFNALKDTNLLDVHFKEISNLISVIQPLKYHPEGDIYNHTMLVVDKVAKITDDESVIFCALTHDFGKACTNPDILPSHIGHEEKGIQIIQEFCNRLRVPKIWKKKAISTCKYHMKAGICKNMKPSTFVKFINNVNKSAIGLKDLNIISNADDMLNREKLQFAILGTDMLNNINGNTLKSENITVKNVGIEKFKQILHQRQIEYIKTRLKK